MRTTAQLRALHAPPCGGDNVTIDFGEHGARITVRRYTLPVWEAVERICAAYGYRIRKQVTGAYNCRKITGGSGYSLHAYAVAVDINWDANPYGKALVTDMPAAMVADFKRIETTDGLQVLRWGGDFGGNKDAMHLEVVVSRSELARGLSVPPSAGGAVKHASSAPAKPRSWIGLGDKGEEVRKLQQQLNEVAGARLVVDGGFGPETEAAVKDFQARHDLAVDGRAGKATFAKIRALRKAAKAAPPPASRRPAKPARAATTTAAAVAADVAVELLVDAPAYPGKPLKRGAKGAPVRTLQVRLATLGTTITVDGDFGPGTERAVEAFQRKALGAGHVDGIVGMRTWAALFA